eukprot:GHVS01022985.1.p1 GENE.GHVS01022985.1~~GHVS01022985.1.p1  ORF type:complete len:129 (-),score=14.45 GHVS01022985.1:649-1035(-)
MALGNSCWYDTFRSVAKIVLGQREFVNEFKRLGQVTVGVKAHLKEVDSYMDAHGFYQALSEVPNITWRLFYTHGDIFHQIKADVELVSKKKKAYPMADGQLLFGRTWWLCLPPPLVLLFVSSSIQWRL